MKKTFLVVCFLLTAYYLLIPNTIYAHQLKTDGNIGAVLHVSPEDDPIAGEQSGFFFEFKDKSGKFDPKNCDCYAYIYLEDKELMAQPLFRENTDPSLTTSSMFFNFPQKGIYILKVKGTPSEEEFQPFTLTYSIRVEKESTNATIQSSDITKNGDFAENSSRTSWIVVVGGVLFTLMVLWVVLRKK